MENSSEFNKNEPSRKYTDKSFETALIMELRIVLASLELPKSVVVFI